MRSPEQQDKDESYEALVDAKLEAMMKDRSTLAAMIDDVISGGPYQDFADNGSTNLANDLATLLLAGRDRNSTAVVARPFIDALETVVALRARLDAETEVADECARSLDDKAELQRQQREDMEH